MHIRSLSDLLDREVRHLHCLEGEMFEVLSELTDSATDTALTAILDHERGLCVWQRERLRMIPRTLGMALSGDPCPDVVGMLDQARQLVRYASEPEVRDAALVASIRRFVAYECACYESARDHARILGEERAAELLTASLEEEEETAHALGGLQCTDAERLQLRMA